MRERKGHGKRRVMMVINLPDGNEDVLQTLREGACSGLSAVCRVEETCMGAGI